MKDNIQEAVRRIINEVRDEALNIISGHSILTVELKDDGTPVWHTASFDINADAQPEKECVGDEISLMDMLIPLIGQYAQKTSEPESEVAGRVAKVLRLVAVQLEQEF